MRYLKEKTTIELVINKSKFIGVLVPCFSNSLIGDEISILKKEYPKANHYCYACITGELGEYYNSSDDGEPSGTAGVPILNTLKHSDTTNLLCVVIRYFGGIKLGAGGLIRAYSNSASQVLGTAKYYIKKKVPTYQWTFKYHLIDKIEHLVSKVGTITNKEFSDECVYTLYLEDNQILTEVSHLLTDCKYLGETILEIDL